MQLYPSNQEKKHNNIKNVRTIQCYCLFNETEGGHANRAKLPSKKLLKEISPETSRLISSFKKYKKFNTHQVKICGHGIPLFILFKHVFVIYAQRNNCMKSGSGDLIYMWSCGQAQS